MAETVNELNYFKADIKFNFILFCQMELVGDETWCGAFVAIQSGVEFTNVFAQRGAFVGDEIKKKEK